MTPRHSVQSRSFPGLLCNRGLQTIKPLGPSCAPCATVRDQKNWDAVDSADTEPLIGGKNRFKLPDVAWNEFVHLATNVTIPICPSQRIFPGKIDNRVPRRPRYDSHRIAARKPARFVPIMWK